MENFKIGDRLFSTHDALLSGDYAGSSVGVANMRFLGENYNVLSISPSALDEYISGDKKLPDDWHIICLNYEFSSRQFYLEETFEETLEILQGLENDHVLDSDCLSEVEMEWEQEAWQE